MEALAVIRDKTQAATLLQGDRARLLAMLREPDSAAGLAKQLRMPRQKVNYHLRELEKTGFVRLVAERRVRNCIERVVQATARAYVVSPEVLAELGGGVAEDRDRFSSAYLLSLAARTLEELGVLRARAKAARKKLATLSLESTVRFASAADRNAFAEELAAFTAQLAAKYHDGDAPDGRAFRFIAGVYPALQNSEEAGAPPADEEEGHDR